MALLSAKKLHMSFGGPKLLDDVSFQIEAGQRVCIVGRNGEGKSTLLRLLSGDLTQDAGTISHSQGVTVARLSQKVPEELSGTVYQVVTGGLGELGQAMADYHKACETSPDKLSEIESRLESLGGWETLAMVETVISKLSLESMAQFETLSGGLKRRALLARALAGNPDILLLDEPTNHLDIDSIAWLEEFLLRQVKTLVFITHDRMFLRKIATRIIELDRGRLSDWSCDYETFLKRKDDLLAAEEKQWKEFDKKLAQEEVWIRQGIQARRTRNEGRVRSLKKMRGERMQRRERVGKANVNIQDAGKSGKMVIETTDVSFTWPESGETVFKNLSTSIMRGDRVGLIGKNGVGKTTLIQVLLGRMKPTSGGIRLGTGLEISYFDQHREELDPDESVRDAVSNGNDTVTINGGTKHVMGYLKDFLFAPDRANGKVRLLSGGERNRLLLAKLFTRPSNLLIMDEPTNDLDAETLELLEDRLMDYPGTVIIVSHDRAFLNNVVTSTIALEGEGRVAEYVGGYDDWLRQRPEPVDESKPEPKACKPALTNETQPKKRKLTFGEQREIKELEEKLAALPARIEQLESDVEAAHAKMAEPDFYKSSGEEIATAKDGLASLEAELEKVFARWEESEMRLEELREVA